MTDRYDDPSTPDPDAAKDDTARGAAPTPAPETDATDAVRDARVDTGDIDLHEGERVDTGTQVGARTHVNARRATHTEVPDTEEDERLPGRETSSGLGVEAPQYGVGPFSIREVALLGIWAVTFLVSFFPLNNLPANVRVLGGGSNVWLSGLWWIPAVALPTVAVGLLVLRRLSPQGIRRVGSLGIDQFASVAFSVAALVWIAWVWDTVSVAAETGIWTRTWVVWVGAVFTLAGVVLTVFAPIIPPFEQDFQGRGEVPAHRNARPVRAVVKRPARPRTVRTPPAVAPGDHGQQRVADRGPIPGSYTGSTDLPHTTEAEPATSVLPTHGDTQDTDVIGAGSPTPAGHADPAGYAADHSGHVSEHSGHDAAPRHPQPQAFWALAPEERDVVDDYGTPIFRVGPTAWALVIEDRGETFVIRHDDGRIGYLHDVQGVTRG